MNPAELAQKRRALELSKLKEENEKLKQRLKMLEESGGHVDDLAVKVEQKMLQPSSSKQVTGSCALLIVMLKLNVFIAGSFRVSLFMDLRYPWNLETEPWHFYDK